ncbi:hypothetical protein DFS34DRAFT_464029 [Phlyctochytrium arcticum]|nr:hypothetical protein DFS34DRAFT_464029 [Phlyctochytrium arcticum]
MSVQDPQAPTLGQLYAAETALSSHLKEVEKKLRLELQLKQSAAAMAKVHTDRKARGVAEQQVQVAGRNVEHLSDDLVKVLGEFRGVVERARAMERWQVQAQAASMRGEEQPPMPPPRDHTAGIKVSDSQRTTSELYTPRNSRMSVMADAAAPPPPRRDSRSNLVASGVPYVTGGSSPNRSSRSVSPDVSLGGGQYYPAMSPAAEMNGSHYDSPQHHQDQHLAQRQYQLQELGQRVQHQADEISRKDIELGHMAALLREAQEHLQHVVQQQQQQQQEHRDTPPPVPPRDTSSNQSRVSELTREKESLQSELRDAHKLIADLRRYSVAESVSDQMQHVMEERDQLVQALTRFEHENQMLRERLDVISRTETGSGDAGERYLPQIDLLQQHLEAVTARNGNLDSQVRHLAHLLETRMDQGHPEGTSRDLQDDATSPEERLLVDSLTAKIAAVENTLLSTKENAERKRQVLRLNLEEAQRKIDNLSNRNAELESKQSSSLTIANPDITTQDELSTLRGLLHDSESSMAALRAQIADMEQQWADASRQQMAEYQDEINALEMKLQIFTPELERAQAENEQLKASMGEGTGGLDEQHKKEAEMLMQQHREREAKLEQEISENAQKLAHAEQRIHDLENELSTKQQQYDQTLAERTANHEQSLASSHLEYEQAMAQMMSDHDKARAEFESAAAKSNADIRQQVEILQVEVSGLVLQNEELKSLLHDSESTRSRLLTAEARAKTTESELRDMLSKAETEVTTLRAARAVLVDEVEMVGREVEHLGAERAGMLGEVEGLEARVKNLESELLGQRTAMQTVTAERDTANRALEEVQKREQVRNAEDQSRSLNPAGGGDVEEEVARLCAQVEEMRIAKEDLASRLHHVIADNESQQDLTHQLHQSQSQIESLTAALAAERGVVQTLQAQSEETARLETELHTWKSKVDALVTDLETERAGKIQDIHAVTLESEAVVSEWKTKAETLAGDLENERSSRIEMVGRAAALERRVEELSSLANGGEKGEVSHERVLKERDEAINEANTLRNQLHSLTQDLDSLRSQLSHLQSQQQQQQQAYPPRTSSSEDSTHLADLLEKNTTLTFMLADKERELEEARRKIRKEGGAATKSGWW